MSAELDRNRSVSLNEYGCKYTAGVIVDALGRENFVLVDFGAMESSFDPWAKRVAHEQTGRLPAEWLARIETARA
jgi:hypothetical protein